MPAAPGASESTSSIGNLVEVPAYLPVDARENPIPCVVAAALAAGASSECELKVRAVKAANPEYRRVAVIASAVAAACHGADTLRVKRIYRITDQVTASTER